ncbi:MULTISPECIES: DEAD/DEAH box helicase [Methylobacterium]|uniref:ATP-dependent RNA helicase DeaD n=3 Tax=Methylobacterium TaxID=407 RepID=A0AAE8HVL9_9HYPH|nr:MULTISPECIES: DEAD/DEAH box helicase [Methylobacterium]KOX55403.1 helicase [Streptomyces purpurogeneiscleroticus]AIQ91659.1 DEAD/DEAH box helicase domain-containing protein [Methylobacterium oryzae CBMB20]APT32177.1 DEAD-box ATP-dependent RNA helicase CshB [Methylobacterium phyllosphaerae]AWV16557.1 helicase [Methylobacterium sp. XJLW]MBA9062409.1 ATP-dependent RNA helicase DeaD [Methylobacterium fujisawaense]
MPFPTLPAPLARALSDRGYADPTPVQAAVLEAAAGSRDLLVSAQTGSGKTVAYGLAMASILIGEADQLPPPAAPLALVIAPTRELALQVQRELSWLYGPAGGRVAACVGGMDPRRESRMLAEGTHIVVGTPGRLRDHLERRNLDPTALRAVVLDEADEMLDLGFREDIEFILSATPPERATYLFSATLPKAIETLAERYQHGALRLAIKGETKGHADIAYRAVRIMPRETEHVVLNLLREADAATAIVFCNTRNAVRHLQASLTERGFSVVALSGELGQGERNAALQALRDGRARVCVATDVAARGIDLPSLSLVIHADLPHDAEVLQHRSGRTGRAGRKGTSVLLIPNSRRRRAEQMFAIAKVSPEWSGPPSADEIRRLDGERMLSDPLFAEPPAEEDVALAETLLAGKSPEELAALLARVYRTRLPAPEEVSDPGEGRAPRGERPPYDPMDPERIAAMGPAVWFRLNLGRRDNADPRRLLPMLTRRGGIGRQEIGAIRIFDRETKFEVRGNAAARFAEAFARNGSPDIQVEALVGDAGPDERRDRPGGPKGFASPRAGKHQRKVDRTGPKSDKAGRHSGRA